jgi:tetratricopeptide (TPR) repeat protein
MKKIIFFIIVLLIPAILVVVYVTDSSHKVYKDAESLFNQGKVREAHDKVIEALEINGLNRKALALKAKAFVIVKSQDDYKRAEDLYKESVSLALNGKAEEASLKLIQAVEILDDIPLSVPIKPQAEQLIAKIFRDSESLLRRTPEILLRRAKSLYNQGDYMRAFENVNRINIDTQEVRVLKSSAAYKAGMDVYSKLKNLRDVSNAELYDAIYWFEQVENGSIDYNDAQKKLSELREMVN